MSRAAGIVLVSLLAGCSGGPDGAVDAGAGDPDAPGISTGPVEFRWLARVDGFTPGDPKPFEVLVNGATVPGQAESWYAEINRTFATFAEAQSYTFTAEVYLDGELLTRREDGPGRCDEQPSWSTSTLEQETASLCVEHNGELRLYATTCVYANGGGVADYTCPPVCRPLSTAPGVCDSDKCGLAVKLADPYYAHVACVPAGARVAGESCTVDANGHDDCAAGSGCYVGACRAWCNSFNPCESGTCTSLPRIDDGFGVCM